MGVFQVETLGASLSFALVFQSIRVVGFFVLATSVAISGVMLTPVSAAEAALGVLEADDVAPLVSKKLTTFLGGAEPEPLAAPKSDPVIIRPEKPKMTPSSTPATFDPATATLIGRDESTDRYRDAAGKKWAVLHAVPTNVLDATTGRFEPLEESFTATADGIEATRHPLNVELASSGNDRSLMSLEHSGYTLDVSLSGAADVPLRGNGSIRRATSEIEYVDIFPDVDLAVQLDGATLTEQLRLAEAPAQAPQWRWSYRAPGLTVAKNDFEDIEFSTPTGEVVFSIPSPVMWDSSGIEGESEDAVANVATKMVVTPTGVDLILSPSLQWLSSKDRVYPVHVDPSINPGQTSLHSYRSDNGTRIDRAWVGNSRDGGDKYWRAIIKYDYSALAGKYVTYGQHQVAWADGVTASVGGGVVNYASCFGYNCVGTQLGTFTVGGGVAPLTSDIALTQHYAFWVSTNNFGAYLMLRNAEVPGQYTFKGLNSALYLQYEDFPAVTGIDTSVSPVNGSSNAPLAPILKATATGAGLSYYYRVWNNAQLSGTPVFESPAWGGQAQQVPQGNLSGAATYWWKAYVRDGVNNTYGVSTTREGPAFSFTTNVPAPAPDPSTVIPLDEAVVTTLTPTLAGTAQPSAPAGTKYQFRVTTGTDGDTGSIISSDWLTMPSWTVPLGVLQDGGSYRWRIATDNGVQKANSTWLRRLQVNLRVGLSGPSPKDSVGAVTVNLANGNASLNFSSPTIDTVGGPMGQSFAYNSLAVRADGLTARYFSAVPLGGGTPTFTFDGKLPLLTRTDSGIDFNWGLESPGPAVPADQFLGRWTGFVNLPAGDYKFGVTRDDGARVWVNGALVYDKWENATTATGTDVQPGTVTELPWV